MDIAHVTYCVVELQSNITCTYMVIIGATESKLAIKIPISEIQAVSIKARVGSPDFEP